MNRCYKIIAAALVIEGLLALWFYVVQPQCEPCLEGYDCPPCISDMQKTIIGVMIVLLVAALAALLWCWWKRRSSPASS